MWDNQSLLHIALRDYDEVHEPRHLYRAATLGRRSGREISYADLQVVP